MSAADFSSSQLRAVLWDMDGTLIDSEPLWMSAEIAMLDRYSLELTDEVRHQLIGTGLRAAAELFQRMGVPLSSDEIIAEWVAEVGRGLAETAPQWRPGAVELLDSLQQAGIPSAMVTMSVRTLADQVSAMLPAGSFTAIVAGDEVEHEKPHPDPYLRGAALLGVKIADCLTLEDSRTGLTSASASGAVSIGVPNFVDLGGVPAHALWPTLSAHSATTLQQQFLQLRPTAL